MRREQNYRVIRKIDNGIVLLHHPDYGQQLWSTVKVRKHKKCIFTGVDLQKKWAYSPITNMNNRMHRISIEAMEKIPLI